MKKQVVVWTSLPDGFALSESKEGGLYLSVLVSPRIYLDPEEEDKSLSGTDFLDWPRHLRELCKGGFSVEIEGGPTLTLRPNPRAFDSGLWRRLFPPQTRVDGYEFDRYQDREILSYPRGILLDKVRELYQHAGEDGFYFDLMRSGLVEDAPVDDVDETARQAFRDFKRFHGWGQGGGNGPSEAQPWQPSIDFHQTISGLSNYPVLMRRLGLVIDLVLPRLAPIPRSSRLRALPRISLGRKPSGKVPSYELDFAPFTLYDLDPGTRSFRPKPRGGSGEEMKDGRLCLGNRKLFGLEPLDADGAAMKQLLLAESQLRSDEARDELAALRSTGIAVYRTDIADELRDSFAHAAHWNQVLESDFDPDAMAAGAQMYQEDLITGYRVDVWEEGADPAFRRWYSLCRRVGHYRVGDDSLLEEQEDEGWVETAVSDSPETGDAAAPAGQQRIGALKVSEVLFRWEGWSLCAPRPGKKAADGAASVTVQNPSHTSSGLSVSFRAKEGSLPRLRYGGTYRFRMRLVDLAGNSERLSEDEPVGPCDATPPLTYYRFQPVESPVILFVDSERMDDSPGESIDRLVVRSESGKASSDRTERYFAPPPASVALGEAHGMFDKADGSPDPEAFALIASHDGPVQVTRDYPAGRGERSGIVPARITYLPDPLARGISVFSDEVAPNGVTMGQVYGFGYYGITGLLHRPEWPKAQPILAVLRSGDGFRTDWNPVTSCLQVTLPPAKTWRVRISSKLHADQVPLLGIWQWLREADKHPSPEKAAEGVNPQLTPSREIELVHAVKHPLEKPVLELQDPEAPDSDMPLRRKGEPFVRLAGRVRVHSESTGKLDLVATWSEPLYDPKAAAGYVSKCGRSLVVSVSVERFSDTIDWAHSEQPGGNAPRHIFGDTKHRRVRYWPVAGTRFREYFHASGKLPMPVRSPDCHNPAPLVSEPDFQVLGDAVDLSIPSSARPATPRPLYAIPTFRWEDWRQGGPQAPDGTHSWLQGHRHGGGLRIYLEGTWYESGEGERLAVVIPDLESLVGQEEPWRQALLPLVSRWGLDPVRMPLYSPQAAAQLDGIGWWSFAKSQFGADPQVVEGLTPVELEESRAGAAAAVAPKVTAVSYPVRYDRERGLWYADIEIDMGRAYFPFVRLALARIQPASVSGLELSPVALADFVQVAPDRSAWVKVTHDDKAPGRLAWISITGPAPLIEKRTDALSGLGMTACVERQDARIGDPDLGWHPVADSTLTLEAEPGETGFMWWTGGPVKIPPSTQSRRLRLMIHEYQYFYRHGTSADLTIEGSPTKTSRLVYAHALPLDE